MPYLIMNDPISVFFVEGRFLALRALVCEASVACSVSVYGSSDSSPLRCLEVTNDVMGYYSRRLGSYIETYGRQLDDRRGADQVGLGRSASRAAARVLGPLGSH